MTPLSYIGPNPTVLLKQAVDPYANLSWVVVEMLRSRLFLDNITKLRESVYEWVVSVRFLLAAGSSAGVVHRRD